jgi:hypothetical protein
MSFENPLTFVRSLKGAPASVFLALLFARHPMTNRELQRWTGYSEQSISQAAHLLVDLGWLSALGPRGPWTLGDGRQLPLMASLPAEVPAAAPVNNHVEPPHDAEEMEDANVVKTLYALYDAGIHEPTAGRLARLPDVTPDYVAAHVELANAQGYGLGVAIHRIEHAWPLPEKKAVLTVEDRIRKFLEDR